MPVSEVSGAADAKRAEQIAELFRAVNVKGNGYIDEAEMLPFAKISGHKFGANGWSAEFAASCDKIGADPKKGVDLESFSKLYAGLPDRYLPKLLKKVKASRTSAPAQVDDADEFEDALENPLFEESAPSQGQKRKQADLEPEASKISDSKCRRLELVVGSYKIVADSVVTTSVQATSKVQEVLGAGAHIDAVEIKHQIEHELVRARLSTGGWVTLEDTHSKKKWAEPIQLGAYVTSADATVVSATASLSSEDLRELPEGDYIEVVEIKYVKDDKRVRGKLACGGWVSLMDTETRVPWAVPIQLGSYKIKTNTSVTAESNANSEDLHELNAGARVDVVQVKYLAEEQRVRGKLASKGWISLIDSKDGVRWAEFAKHQPDVEILNIESVEMRLVGERQWTQARLSNGVWIGLQLGAYKTTADATTVSAEVSIDSEELQELQSGSLIDVVKVKYVPKDKRVRGKLDSGGWISLENTETNEKWATPL